MTRHVHLDVTGGISGDMFLAAMLSAFPAARDKLEADFALAGLTGLVDLTTNTVREKGFAGTRVKVAVTGGAPATRTWSDIRSRLDTSKLADKVKKPAIAIFQLLAEAEARCHAISVDDVHFHELADWDSIADIVGAASLMDFVRADQWSVSALPLGHGTVKTRHGLIPVPAPATADLLKGFAFIDDGGRGERITPTGAAILKHLQPTQQATGPRGTLTTTGTGAGTMQIDGIANILRVLVFDAPVIAPEVVRLVRFDIDDMTPEELALALDRLRSVEGVLDAGHVTGIGKKGRPQFSVSVMTRPAVTDEIVTLCFAETSTIGLRVETAVRHVLARSEHNHAGLRIKTVARPNGTTAKAESDDLARHATLHERRRRAHEAEATTGEHDE